MNTAIIGSGNVAWHLAPALDNIGYPVREVYSRQIDHAQELVKRLYEATAVDELDFSESSCKLFIIAVADDAVEYIATEIILPEDAIVVHTSGTQPLSVLGYLATEDIGVFYPLQTFSKSFDVKFGSIPIFIESETKMTKNTLFDIGEKLKSPINILNTQDRKILHLSAVFASNFTNHLLTIAEDILTRKGLELEYLFPLISETLQKAINIGPANSQTGPAKRNDSKIIQQHLQLLDDRQDLSILYQMLSESIEKYHPSSQS